MARPLRIEFPGATYHIMNWGRAQQRTFLGQEDYQRFLQKLAQTHARWSVAGFAYCLLGTHYQACLPTPAGILAQKTCPHN